MRRRVVCPRSHPASPYLRRLFGRLRYGSRYFPGGYPRAPMSPYLRLLRPQRPRPRLAAPRSAPPGETRCRLGTARSSGRCGPSPTHRLRAAQRGSSWAGAGAAEAVFAGRCGLGAASSLRMRLWRRIFASEPVVAPHLRFSLCRGAQARLHTPQRPGLRSCPPTRVAPRPLPGRPLFTLRTLVTLRLRHAAIFLRRGYRPWQGKPSRRTCMSTVPGRDASPRRNPQPAHIP
jgi:hypothetical protein